MEKLSPDQVEQRTAEVPQWSVNGDLLQRTLGFDDFNAAVAFVNRLRDLAEARQHHPDIMIRYNKVTLTMSTHDAPLPVTVLTMLCNVSRDPLPSVSMFMKKSRNVAGHR